jgi:hypothetical protein
MLDSNSKSYSTAFFMTGLCSNVGIRIPKSELLSPTTNRGLSLARLNT